MISVRLFTDGTNYVFYSFEISCIVERNKCMYFRKKIKKVYIDLFKPNQRFFSGYFICQLMYKKAVLGFLI